MSNLKKSNQYSAIVCFIPILIFMVVELLNDFNYVKKNKGRLSFEYLYMGLMALILFLYIKYTINKDIIMNPIENDDKNKKIEEEKKILKKNVLFGLMCF